MSRTTTGRPEFRLLFGYPHITLTREDRTAPLGRVSSGSPEFTAELRDLADEVVGADGRLTVVLPEAEVWRGRIEPSGPTRLTRRRSARRRAASELGIPASDVALVVAKSGDAAAATRLSTLADVRSLIGEVGLRADAIVGEGDFEGFPTSPEFGRRPPVSGYAVGAGGLVAAAAALFLTLPSNAPLPAAALLPPAPASMEIALAPPAPKPVIAQAAPLALAQSGRPVDRPKSVPPASSLPLVTQGTRSVDFLWVKPERGGVPELRLAELTTARARMTDVTLQPPLPRPTAATLLDPPATTTPTATTADAGGPRPMHRPGKPIPSGAVAMAAPALPASAGFGRPRPRPDGPSIKVASLAPETAAVAGLAAASVLATPPARPATLRTSSPKPTPIAKVATVSVVKPKPVSISAIQAAPVTPRPVVKAAPQRVVTVAPRVVAAPVPQAARAPVALNPTPARKTTAQVAAVRPATAAFNGSVRSGVSRGNVSLIGVFGGADGLHALLKLPNGQIERVRAGDQVQGIQVAAISKDSVQITGRGRNTLLRLPD